MKMIIVILVISVLGNLLGLFFAYKYIKGSRRLNAVTQSFIQTRVVYNKQFRQHLLFIHHSVGESWLNQGGLKDSLSRLGIGVHSATYGSDIGQNTDMSDWVSKFNKHFEKMMKYDIPPDILYHAGMENDIIMFKPCFPNSDISSDGTPPGNPFENARTVWNYKSVFEDLRGYFSKAPQKLFIYVTAPPLVPGQTSIENAGRIRQFNNWVKNDFVNDYKKQAGSANFLVFDLFDVLADSSNCLQPGYRNSDTDSHPNANGCREATSHFLRFLGENNILKPGQAQ